MLNDGSPYVKVHGDSIALHFDNECVQSMMSSADPVELVVPYTRTMMGFLLVNPRPRRILMLGLGGGSLVKFCYAHLPDARITVVEIDPQVIALRGLFMIPPDDGRLQVVCAEGAAYVRDSAEDFDVILVDGFDLNGQSATLTTPAFFQHCFERLTPEGILVENLDSEHPAHAFFFALAWRRFKENAVEVPVPERTNSIVFATKDMSIRTCWHRWQPVPPESAASAQPQDWALALQDEFARILLLLHSP